MPINTELVENADTLVIAATGFKNQFCLKIDKFFESSNLTTASKIIIIDPTRKKTLNGLHPEFKSFFDVVDYLQEKISFIQPKRLITTGVSGGGHTALLLGHLLKADHAVAFAPYPYLNIETARKMQDPVEKLIQKIMKEVNEIPDAVKKYLDLRPLLSTWNGKTKYDVHVSRNHEWDYYRATYLRGCPNVSIISHPFEEHGISKKLAHSNQLSQCFVSE